MSYTTREANCAAQSDPDRNKAFRGWSQRYIPRDAASLDRLADLEQACGHFAAADRLAWMAAGLRETAT